MVSLNPFKFLLLLSLLCRSGARWPELTDPAASLKVPVTEFVGSVRETIEMIGEVISMVSQFAGDFRVSNAVSDCLDLMDLSLDQLSATLAAVTENPNRKDKSTGNVGADMRTWLSGVVANQETCREGFDGTNSFLKNLLTSSLDQVTSLVYQILVNVRPPPPPPPLPFPSGGIGSDEFPDWLKPHDMKLLHGAVADAVVALDGSGNFSAIKDALLAAPELSTRRFVIYVKKGVYKEYVEIGKKKWNIMIIGDGVDATVISGDRNFVDGWTTFRSATFGVKGKGFIARDITFENTAGAKKHQAVAFRSDSDHSVVYRCRITGYQDTLYAHSSRQFYRECQIIGTVDFIFGDGKAVFQSCDIRARKGLPNQKNTVTAQGRKYSDEETGFSIQFCNITAESTTYLGRPWRPYSRSVIMQSYISDAVRPEGWLEWNGDFALTTLFYAEYMNYGPGSGLGARVKWPGYRVLNSSDDASYFTVSQFICGDSWLPSTGVKYTSGLTV